MGFFFADVKKASPGNERMVFLMTEIQKGAKAFLQAEYKWVGIFAVDPRGRARSSSSLRSQRCPTSSVRSCPPAPGTPA